MYLDPSLARVLKPVEEHEMCWSFRAQEHYTGSSEYQTWHFLLSSLTGCFVELELQPARLSMMVEARHCCSVFEDSWAQESLDQSRWYFGQLQGFRELIIPMRQPSRLWGIHTRFWGHGVGIGQDLMRLRPQGRTRSELFWPIICAQGHATLMMCKVMACSWWVVVLSHGTQIPC